jgi:hypothetical protein
MRVINEEVFLKSRSQECAVVLPEAENGILGLIIPSTNVSRLIG